MVLFLLWLDFWSFQCSDHSLRALAGIMETGLKAAFLDSVCNIFGLPFNIVNAVMQFSAVRKAESLQACQNFMNLN